MKTTSQHQSDTTVWDKMFDDLENFSDDFMSKREQPTQDREELFSNNQSTATYHLDRYNIHHKNR